ncbi:MAG TPA: nuclear transport factor 2 family protein [Pyrinomonadaceae bacterium]|nr:nuclear transport factor 2 family protein [Pyrinomonadaceae bacterium]
MSPKNKQIVEKLNATFAKGSVEEFLSFCADDVKWTMVGNKPIQGKKTICEWMASMKMQPLNFTVKTLAPVDEIHDRHTFATLWRSTPSMSTFNQGLRSRAPSRSRLSV